jgi:hypothetical protein
MNAAGVFGNDDRLELLRLQRTQFSDRDAKWVTLGDPRANLHPTGTVGSWRGLEVVSGQHAEDPTIQVLAAQGRAPVFCCSALYPSAARPRRPAARRYTMGVVEQGFGVASFASALLSKGVSIQATACRHTRLA